MALPNSLTGKNLGMALLGLWLILTGLLPLFGVRVSPTLAAGLSLLAVAAGILIIFGR